MPLRRSQPPAGRARVPKIVERTFYNGAEQRITRLGLTSLWRELEEIITGFELRVEERTDANGAKEARKLFDARFTAAGGWAKQQTGGGCGATLQFGG